MKSAEVDNTLQRFGERIRSYRRKKGISQEKLAEISGLHRTYIGSIERGEQNISLKNIVKIARALGVPAVELLQGVE